jgi:hypothetical protein
MIDYILQRKVVMTSMKLYPHQIDALEQIKDKNRCAVYYDMGL